MSPKPEIEPMFLGRYVCIEHKSSKFWEISKISTIDNAPDRYKISYGRLFTSGQSYEADRNEAWSKLISKLNPNKGYELNSAQYTDSLRCHIKLTRLAKGKTKEAIEDKKIILSNKKYSQAKNEESIDTSASSSASASASASAPAPAPSPTIAPIRRRVRI